VGADFAPVIASGFAQAARLLCLRQVYHGTDEAASALAMRGGCPEQFGSFDHAQDKFAHLNSVEGPGKVGNEDTV